jgi:hypothetical protein
MVAVVQFGTGTLHGLVPALRSIDGLDRNARLLHQQDGFTLRPCTAVVGCLCGLLSPSTARR